MSIRRVCRATTEETKRTRGRAGLIIALFFLVVFVGAGVGGYLYYRGLPVKITVETAHTTDDHDATVDYGTTIAELYATGELTAVAGDLLAIDGSVLTEGGGEPPVTFCNGVEVDEDTKVGTGDVITEADGADVIEGSTVEERKVAYDKLSEGKGALSFVLQKGTYGLQNVEVGEISGAEVVLETTLEPTALIIKKVSIKGHKLIALTFDDGPKSGSTDKILDILKEEGVHATFFTLGKNVEKYPELARRIVAEGNQIATHTYSHKDLSECTSKTVKSEIAKGEVAIEEATGVTTTVVRAPYGSFSPREWAAAGDTISLHVLWNIDTKDWKRPGVDAIVENVIDNAKPGRIVLMHDGGGDRTQTIEALPEIIEELKALGYEFVTIDELYSYAE